jgi:hypothetical protein
LRFSERVPAALYLWQPRACLQLAIAKLRVSVPEAVGGTLSVSVWPCFTFPGEKAAPENGRTGLERCTVAHEVTMSSVSANTTLALPGAHVTWSEPSLRVVIVSLPPPPSTKLCAEPVAIVWLPRLPVMYSCPSALAPSIASGPGWLKKLPKDRRGRDRRLAAAFGEVRGRRRLVVAADLGGNVPWRSRPLAGVRHGLIARLARVEVAGVGEPRSDVTVVQQPAARRDRDRVIAGERHGGRDRPPRSSPAAEASERGHPAPEYV